MSDISKCKGLYTSGKVCELKYKCYRFTAEANPIRQSYLLPPEEPEEDCKILYPIRN